MDNKERQNRNRELIEFTKRKENWKDKLNQWATKFTMLGAAIMAIGSILIAIAFFAPDPKGGRRITAPVDVDTTTEDETPFKVAEDI